MSCVLFYIFTVLLFYWQCCLLILYIVFCCLHCDCLGLAAIKWFLTAFETLNLLTYYVDCCRWSSIRVITAAWRPRLSSMFYCHLQISFLLCRVVFFPGNLLDKIISVMVHTGGHIIRFFFCANFVSYLFLIFFAGFLN